MGSRCPKCRAEIPAEYINVNKGIAKCDCGEVFAIGFSGEGQKKVSEPIPEKPPDTNVLVEEIGDREMFIRFPNLIQNIGKATCGTWVGTVFVVGLTCVWNFFVWVDLILLLFGVGEFGKFEKATLLMRVPFMIVGLGLILLVLYGFFGSYNVRVGDKAVIVSRGLFGIRYKRDIPLSLINNITIGPAFKEYEHKKVVGNKNAIHIEHGVKTQKVGAGFSDDELRWVAHEMRRFVQKLRDR
jgi:hypothetical protein